MIDLDIQCLVSSASINDLNKKIQLLNEMLTHKNYELQKKVKLLKGQFTQKCHSCAHPYVSGGVSDVFYAAS